MRCNLSRLLQLGDDFQYLKMNCKICEEISNMRGDDPSVNLASYASTYIMFEVSKCKRLCRTNEFNQSVFFLLTDYTRSYLFLTRVLFLFEVEVVYCLVIVL